jgi:hypothetical protein
MTIMLRAATLGAAVALAGSLAAPAVAQNVDCANLPQMATAEPMEFAQCAAPIVVVGSNASTASPAWAVNLRASAPTGRGFISYDMEDAGSAALVAADLGAWYAGDFAGNDFSKIYAVETLAIPMLYEINTTTGVRTLIGSTGLADGSNVGGMAWDYTTGTMYANSGPNLYTIDLTTGAMTLVGPMTGMTTPINLISHPQTGALYSVDLSDELYSIDNATGAATLIGPIGTAINFAQGADFDNGTNIAYMCAYEGAGVNSVRTIDLATGTTTEVSSFTNSEVDFCASIVPRVNPSTEPTGNVEASLIVEPNPFSQQTQLVLSVTQEQRVVVEVFDMVGRRVAMLHDAQVAAGQPIVVSLRGSDLRPGVYAVRATGETFVRSQQMTVAR